MKITVEQEKPVFKPIIITLETAQEYFELLAGIAYTSTGSIKESMGRFGVSQLCDSYVDTLYHLYSQLDDLQEQVKETL